jgi:hypothetical protein
MMSISRYIISLCLCIAAAGTLHGQAGRWLPSALRVGTDPGAIGYWALSKQRNFFEVTADTDFNNVYVVADYGYTRYTLEEPTFEYSSQGSYLRFGADINIMKQDKDLNVIFVGLRYAMATFNDRLAYQTGTVLQTAALNRWPDTGQVAENSAAGARWYELTTGLKMRVFSEVYMGFTARYKILKKDRRDSTLSSYYVPGFGKNIDNNAWALNYYVYYRIPFRTKVLPPKSD